MTAKKSGRKQSAGERIREQEKSLIWVTLTDSEKQLIRTVAAFRGMPMSQFLKDQGLAAAEKIMEEIKDRA